MRIKLWHRLCAGGAAHYDKKCLVLYGLMVWYFFWFPAKLSQLLNLLIPPDLSPVFLIDQRRKSMLYVFFCCFSLS